MDYRTVEFTSSFDAIDHLACNKKTWDIPDFLEQQNNADKR